MSAAEKLRALLQVADENDDVPLPAAQIVAVVEAAERVSEKERTGTLPDFMPMAVALAALDEALP